MKVQSYVDDTPVDVMIQNSVSASETPPGLSLGRSVTFDAAPFCVPVDVVNVTPQIVPEKVAEYVLGASVRVHCGVPPAGQSVPEMM